MRRRLVLASTLFSVVLLTGCATPSSGSGAAPAVETVVPRTSIEPSAPSAPPVSIASEGVADAAAQQRAQAWLEAAIVPPGSVSVVESPGPFMSWQGWPCQPVAELEGYWTLADWTLAEATNWLRENPHAGFISTSAGTPPLEGDPSYDTAIVGYIPAEGAQEGIVYTVLKKDAGVAIRAEVAALDAAAVCPSLGPGEMWGAPGTG